MARFLGLEELFEGRHFDREIIVLCERWYLRFKLSFRDLVEMMGERGLSMAHTTIMRWVHHYASEFERRWNRFAQPPKRRHHATITIGIQSGSSELLSPRYPVRRDLLRKN
jgi:transposase-like protein